MQIRYPPTNWILGDLKKCFYIDESDPIGEKIKAFVICGRFFHIFS